LQSLHLLRNHFTQEEWIGALINIDLSNVYKQLSSRLGWYGICTGNHAAGELEA
jgi:hypothetical protein